MRYDENIPSYENSMKKTSFDERIISKDVLVIWESAII